MKHWITTLLIAAAAALPAGAFAADTPVLIGASLALTGPASSLGADEAKALQLALKTANANGGIAGHPLKLEVLDGATDPQKAVLNVRKLITADQAVGIVCCTTTPASMAVIDTVQRAGVPTVSIAAAAAIVEPVEKRKWIFKTPPLDAPMVAAEVRDMQQLGIKRVGFIGFSDSFGQGGLAALKEALAGTDITLDDVEQFARTDTNVSAQAARLVSSGVDAVLIWAIPPGANVAQKGLLGAGYDGVIYQNYGVTSETFMRLGGTGWNGTRLSGQPMVIPDDLPDALPFKPAIEKFVHDYRAAYHGESPSSFAGQAYDALMIFVAAANRVAAANGGQLPALATFRANLRDAIEDLRAFQGVDGTFNFSSTDHVGLGANAAAMMKIENGAFVFVR